MDKIRKLWMPITKLSNGDFAGILSDTSIDRDDECMSKELIDKWVQKQGLPMLANHQNSMENWIGGWKNLKSVTKGMNSALQAQPVFFSGKANPLSEQVQKQVEEAVEMGLNPGVSIGAIPKSYDDVEINGKVYKQWTDAELLECSFVPIQSNRNASYGHIAKSFDLSENGDVEVEQIKEVNKMTQKEIQKDAQPEAPVEEAPVEEPKAEEEAKPEEEAAPEAEEKPAEETPAEETEVEEEKKFDVDAFKKELKKEILAELKESRKVELKATYENTAETKEVDKKDLEPSIKNFVMAGNK
jgi:hypothetical protein